MSEENWPQLEEAASYAQVVKVKVNMDNSSRASRALAAGFSINPSLREITLLRVPKELVELVSDMLCSNTALTVNVRSTL